MKTREHKPTTKDVIIAVRVLLRAKTSKDIDDQTIQIEEVIHNLKYLNHKMKEFWLL